MRSPEGLQASGPGQNGKWSQNHQNRCFSVMRNRPEWDPKARQKPELAHCQKERSMKMSKWSGKEPMVQ